MRSAFLFAAALLAASPLAAQVTLRTAVSLALSSSPRVKSAEDEVAKSRALVSEAKDVYVPAVSVGAGLGDSYGYSPYPPTLFTFTAQSLVYSSSQLDFIASARSGLLAASLGLSDAREAAAEEAALTFAALQHDQERLAVLQQQSSLATRLVEIVDDRMQAGRDSAIDLTTVKLTAAQIHLSLLHTQSETAVDQAHLASLMGMPASGIHAEKEFPPSPLGSATFVPADTTLPAGVAAAFATAAAKQKQARGDARYLYRPQVLLNVQFNRYATFTDTFAHINQTQSSNDQYGPNEEVFGIQINIPLFDKQHQAKARESAADAAHAFHDAQSARLTALDGQVRTSHTIEELRARADVATLEQQLAQLQLAALLAQLQAPPLEGRPQLTPKDEQTARIGEREKYLAVVDNTFQLHQAEISLLRQMGQLEDWVKTAP